MMSAVRRKGYDVDAMLRGEFQCLQTLMTVMTIKNKDVPAVLRRAHHHLDEVAEPYQETSLISPTGLSASSY